MPLQPSFSENEALVQALFEQNAVGVAQSEISTYHISRINQRFCDILGYTQEEMHKLDWRTFTHPDDLPENLNHLSRLRDGRTRAFTMEKRYIRKDGSIAWVNVTVLPMWKPDVPPDYQLVLVEDITLRKKSENALRESEANLSLAQRMAHFAYWKWDAKKESITWSEGLYRIAGLDPEKPLPPFSEHSTLFTPESWQRINSCVQNALSDGMPFKSELTMVRPDGDHRHIDSYIDVIKGKDGSVSALFGAVVDITGHKRTELTLRENAALIRSIGNHLPNGMLYQIVRERDGRRKFAYVSDAVRRFYGCSPEEAMADAGRIYGRVLPEDIPRVHSEEEKANEAFSPFSTECRIKNPDGTVRWSYFSSTPRMLENGSTCWDGIEIDITERKQMEEKLLRERFLSEQIINALPGIFSLFDEDGRYLRWSRNLEIVTGRTADEIRQANPLDFFEGEEKNLVARKIREVFDRGLAQVEAHFVSRDGTRTPYFFTGVRINFEGRPCLIGVGIDITNQKTMEEQLLQARKMEALGRLAGGVAHDFNNMLQAILGYTELALVATEPAGMLRDNLLSIKTAAERSADLTRQLLAFARKQTANPKVLNLNDAVTGILQLLRRLIGENIELSWKPGTDLWPVKMDAAQIDQVLTNLAVNARDAITGQGCVTIETGNVIMDGHCRHNLKDCAPGDYVLLTVTDNGCGMDQNAIEHIFEPFFTTKALGRGTGLGMATVYGIIRQNNGLIEVDSLPGQGTSIRIYFPRSCETLDEKPRMAKVASCGSETILLVEDNETVLSFTETVLKMNGYTVLAARTPDEALDLARTYSGPVHLLITDVVMPGMNGRLLSDRLMSFRPDIRTLFMSGYTADIISNHGVLEPGIMFLQKPFSVNVLSAKVKEILDAVNAGPADSVDQGNNH